MDIISSHIPLLLYYAIYRLIPLLLLAVISYYIIFNALVSSGMTSLNLLQEIANTSKLVDFLI
jgi:hypothetical protein